MTQETKVLTREEAEVIYRSEIKQQILNKLKEESVRSMRHLARRIDRDKTNVRDHLRELEDLDLIELDQDSSFGAGCKVPILKHEKIIAEPIL